jgi:hypothetical protein
MKHLFYFLTILFLAKNTLCAQTSKIDLGLQGSPSLMSMHGNEILNNDHQSGLGFSAGISAQFHVNKHWSVVTDINFERKGTHSDGVLTDNLGEVIGTFRCKQQFDYLALPVLVRYHFGEQIQFFVNAGPFVGYLLHQNNKISSDLFGLTSYSSKADFNPLDAGVSAGFGMTAHFNSKFSYAIELRNNLGIYNISALPVINNEKVQTNSLNLSVSLRYLLN